MKNKFGHAAYFTGALPVIMKLRTTYLKVTDDEGNVYEGQLNEDGEMATEAE